MTKKVQSRARREVGHQLSFALYGAANRVARLHKAILEPLGLTFPQYLVMLELLSGTPKSVGEVGGEARSGYRYDYTLDKASRGIGHGDTGA